MPDEHPIVQRPGWPSIEEMERNPPTYQHAMELAVKWHRYADQLELTRDFERRTDRNRFRLGMARSALADLDGMALTPQMSKDVDAIDRWLVELYTLTYELTLEQVMNSWKHQTKKVDEGGQ